MKRELFIISIIINFHFVTLNTSRINIFERLLKYWTDLDDGYDNESKCQIDMSRKMDGGRQNPQPLLIHSGTSKFFHPTDRSGVLRMKRDDKIELFCTNGFALTSTYLSDIVEDDNRNSVTIKCSGSDGFQIDGDDSHVKLVDFSCNRHPRHSARRRLPLSTRCYNNASLVDVGFQVDDKRFLKVLTVCHDSKNEQTYYAQYQLTPANFAAHQRAIKRPSFIQSDFFPGKDINLLYSRRHQREIISEFIIASSSRDANDDSMYLSRGHLAAKGDFIYGNEQRATFYYVNVMPQWQSFNSLNWRAVEDSSRRLAADRNITLTVYTGTHGVTTLRDVNGKSHEIYLDMVNKQVPVPKLFYKILINMKANSGIALVCANNVHISLDEIQRNYIICEDISDEIKYVKWRRKEIRRGYCYSCRVNDFLVKVPHLNGIYVKNLLI